MNPGILCDRTRKGIINSAQDRGTDRRSHKEGAVEGPVGPHDDATSGCDPAFVTPALQYRRLIIISSYMAPPPPPSRMARHQAKPFNSNHIND